MPRIKLKQVDQIILVSMVGKCFSVKLNILPYYLLRLSLLLFS